MRAKGKLYRQLKVGSADELKIGVKNKLKEISIKQKL